MKYKSKDLTPAAFFCKLNINKLTLNRGHSLFLFILFTLFSLSGCGVYSREDTLQRILAGLWGVYLSSWAIYQIKDRAHKKYRVILGIITVIISMITPILFDSGSTIYGAPGPIISITSMAKARAMQCCAGVQSILCYGLILGVVFVPIALLSLIPDSLCKKKDKDGFLPFLLPSAFVYILIFVFYWFNE